MADWADPRPMSPHLQVWRFHVTMAVSILNRGAGIALYCGIVALVVWLAALAAGPTAYDAFIALFPGWLIWGALYLLAAVLAFHAANGVRHLVWDMGKGFAPKTASAFAWLAIALALAAPVALFLVMQGRGL